MRALWLRTLPEPRLPELPEELLEDDRRWTPRDEDPATVWAALDCPGGWATDLAGDPKAIGATGLRGKYIYHKDASWLPKGLRERVYEDAIKSDMFDDTAVTFIPGSAR